MPGSDLESESTSQQAVVPETEVKQSPDVKPEVSSVSFSDVGEDVIIPQSDTPLLASAAAIDNNNEKTIAEEGTEVRNRKPAL